jgi:hypothetical protein
MYLISTAITSTKIIVAVVVVVVVGAAAAFVWMRSRKSAA